MPQESRPERNGRTTILDAVCAVLDDVPRDAAEIYALIVKRDLFTFKAREPVAMVRAAIRKHLRSEDGDESPLRRVRVVGQRFCRP